LLHPWDVFAAAATTKEHALVKEKFFPVNPSLYQDKVFRSMSSQARDLYFAAMSCENATRTNLGAFYADIADIGSKISLSGDELRGCLAELADADYLHVENGRSLDAIIAPKRLEGITVESGNAAVHYLEALEYPIGDRPTNHWGRVVNTVLGVVAEYCRNPDLKWNKPASKENGESQTDKIRRLTLSVATNAYGAGHLEPKVVEALTGGRQVGDREPSVLHGTGLGSEGPVDSNPLEAPSISDSSPSPNTNSNSNPNSKGKGTGPPQGEDIAEIIKYLNSRTAQNYPPDDEKTKSLIQSWVDEGNTLEDFKAVIDLKAKEWLGSPKMFSYLRPSTLFGQEHFSEYLQAAKAQLHRRSPRPDEPEIQLGVKRTPEELAEIDRLMGIVVQPGGKND